MVRQAQSSKAIGQLADKISAIFVPVVVGIALLSAAIWYFFGPAPQIVTLVIATTVLIIACPCALSLATPMSIISGVGRAAELACWSVMLTPCNGQARWTPLSLIKPARSPRANRRWWPSVPLAVRRRTPCATAAAGTRFQPPAGALSWKAGDGRLPQVSNFRTLRGLGVSGEAKAIRCCWAARHC